MTNVHQELLQITGQMLKTSGLRLAVAESCTGGLLGGALTELSGSSEYMLGGVIAYDDSVKRNLLGVPAALIESQGAVSAATALAMARGVIRVTGAALGVAVTGISGPTGGTVSKPVGTTYIAIVAPDMERVEQFCWSSDRTTNRARTVDAALSMISEYAQKVIDRQQIENQST
ncbi:MAG TPA: CinA family protein [Chloroflexia bacterium]|nr:CinA family protein [Chloroflexia bacterium]